MKSWAEKAIAKYERKDDWGIECVSSTEVQYLLLKEHARSVRICRQARMLKFHGLRDTDTNEWLDGYEAACCDILAALQRGRGGKG